MSAFGAFAPQFLPPRPFYTVPREVVRTASTFVDGLVGDRNGSLNVLESALGRQLFRFVNPPLSSAFNDITRGLFFGNPAVDPNRNFRFGYEQMSDVLPPFGSELNRLAARTLSPLRVDSTDFAPRPPFRFF